MPNAMFDGRMAPSGSGIYRRDSSGATFTVSGTGTQWADNSASTDARFGIGGIAAADFAAQSDLALDMGGEVTSYGAGGCLITLRRKSTNAVLAVSTECGYWGSTSWFAVPHTWATVNEDPYFALADGDLLVETSHTATATGEVRVSDLLFDVTTELPQPPALTGYPRRGPRLYPLKSQQWTARRGPGSFY